MRAQIALSAFSAMALAGALFCSAPASAAPVDDVIRACDRTAGCNYKIEGNGISGCSPNACFRCPADGSRQCSQVPQQSRTQPGSSPPGGGPIVGGVAPRMGSGQSMQLVRPHSYNRLR